MVMQQPLNVTESDTTGRVGETKRGLSDIVFAAYDLDTAIEAARIVRDGDLDGLTVDAAQSAVASATTYSTFRNKLYNAAKFGLVALRRNRDTGQTEVFLLPLAHQILDATTEREARVAAFLHVELNRALYARFANGPLPSSDAEFERIIQELGVTVRQAPNARQVFMRSARQAHFFEQGRDRLTMPADVTPADFAATTPVALSANSAVVERDLPEEQAITESPAPIVMHERDEAGEGVQDVADSDRAIMAWLEKMPRPGTPWSKAKRERWLETLGGILDYLFDDEA